MVTFLIRLVANSGILIQKLFIFFFRHFSRGCKAQDSGSGDCVLREKAVIADK